MRMAEELHPGYLGGVKNTDKQLDGGGDISLMEIRCLSVGTLFARETEVLPSNTDSR